MLCACTHTHTRTLHTHTHTQKYYEETTAKLPRSVNEQLRSGSQKCQTPLACTLETTCSAAVQVVQETFVIRLN